jgi:hypothetical protein
MTKILQYIEVPAKRHALMQFLPKLMVLGGAVVALIVSVVGLTH